MEVIGKVPRPLSQKFVCDPLEALLRQLLQYAPLDKQAKQVRRAETVHDELDPDGAYPLDYVIYRVTGYRPDTPHDEMIPGDVARADLRLMIDRLSHASPLPPNEDEQAEDVPTLSTRLGINRKTVDRWRQTGLRWRWVKYAEKDQPTLVVPRLALERFEEQHATRVAKAKAFGQMPDEMRQAMIARARELSQDSALSFNAIAQELARQHGRGLETVRQLLEKHDRDHPGDAIFTLRDGPLSSRQRRVIVRAHRMGIRTAHIARHVRRTSPTVLRVVREHDLRQLKSIALEYVTLPTFELDDAENVILGKSLSLRYMKVKSLPNDQALPKVLAAVMSQETLEPASQRDLVLRMHMLRFAVDRYRKGTSLRGIRRGDLDLAFARLREAQAIENRLVLLHLRAAWSVVLRQFDSTSSSRASAAWLALIEAASMMPALLAELDPRRHATAERHLRNKLMRLWVQKDRQGKVQAHERLDESTFIRRLLVEPGYASAVAGEAENE